VADLAALLATPRRGEFDVWVDVTSPAMHDALTVVDLDGRRHGGLPFRFEGRHLVRMRHLPGNESARVIAQGLEAARAWALERMADTDTVAMDYHLTWTLALALSEHPDVAAKRGLAELLAVANTQGDWLSDWISEHVDSPEVRAVVDADMAEAADLDLSAAPAICIGGGPLPDSPEPVPDQVRRLLANV
jgi:hypothetical protein